MAWRANDDRTGDNDMAMMPPNAPPPSPTAGAPAPTVGASPAITNPIAALAQRGQGGMPDQTQQMMLLGILVGLGLPEFARVKEKLNPTAKAGKQTAMGREAAANPGTANPQATAQLLQRLAMMRQMGAGGGAGGNPMAALLGR